ncbi:tetratricopeptide repeat protein [Terriglobus albidus]|uniref:Tetratricopeptide repeat protein n=1 Tax=Terriglobus albidus TaxID=1592106 RepID=A0A5B9EHU0_9BACT|nr:tetratricopeptide repeat protein [Terriglobus albidus]QEE29636.1 tetratricopeptide repeat protein [Terriglobus albidus]
MMTKLKPDRVGIMILAIFCVSATGCFRDPKVQRVKYLESGRRYEREGKYQEAAIQFANALKADKNFGDAHYELAKTYIQMNMAQAAFNELQRTVDLAPDNIAARMDLGDLALAGKQYGITEDQASAILSIQPNNADAHAMLAKAKAENGDTAAAMDEIKKALSIDPNRARFHTLLGMLQSGGANPGGTAQAELKKAIELDPKDATAHLALAFMLQGQNNPSGAEREFAAAVSSSPGNLQARVSLAALYIQQGEHAKAEAILQKASEELRDSPQAVGLLKDYYIRNSQLDQAESAYAAMSQRHPDSVSLKLAYANILVAQNKITQAQTIADEAGRLRESDPRLAVLKGMILLNQKRADDAYKLLQDAAKNSPDNIEVSLWLGVAARTKGDFPLAQQSFKKVLIAEPSNFSALQGTAELASAKGDMDLLRQIATSTVKAYPASGDGFLWLGTAEANDKQFEKAADDFQRALKADPKNSTAMLELAQVRLTQRHVPEARALLERAVEVNGNPQALHLLVLSDLQSKQADKALNRVREQAGRFPQSAALNNELALLQLERKDLAGAATSAERAMHLDPSDSAAVKIYTETQLALGNTPAAISRWQQWSASHPKDAQGLSILGMLEEASGDHSKAMDYYKNALEIQPDQPMASNNLAYLMVENDMNLDVALSLAQTAHRGLPNSPSTADTLAWVYFHKGAYDMARDLLEDAAAKDPKNASIQYHLGMTYSRLNQKADARTHLQKAVSLAPNTQTMSAATQELQRLG